MTERIGRPDSEEERTIWFANLAPDASNLSFDNFKFGLGVTDEIFVTIQELIDQAYENHDLDNAALLPRGPDFRRAVTEATRDLLTIFEVVPADWMNTWCEALMLDIWSKKRAEKEAIHAGKEPLPALADSPTAGNEILHFSQPPPRPDPSEPVQQKKKEPLPLNQRTFVLEVVNSDQPSLQAPHILEIISVRCVAEGRDPKLVKNYQLNLFINEFEDILNSGNPDGPRKLSHGKIVYFYGGSGNRALGHGRGTRRMIVTQRHFEVAVAHLLNHTNGDSLTFTFFSEDSQETKQRLAAERRADGAAKQAEQVKLKQRQDKQRAQEAREKRENATVEALAKSKAQAPPIPQKDSRRKGGERLRPGEPSEPSGRRPVPHQIRIPERGPGPGSTRKQPLHPSAAPQLYDPSLTSTAGKSSDPSGKNLGTDELRVPDKGSTSKGATIKSRNPSTTNSFEPISMSTPKKSAPAVNYSRSLLPFEGVLNRPYPTSSSPSTIDKPPLKKEYGSVLHPGASTPPPLRRRRKVTSAVFEAVNTGKRLMAVLDGTATDPKNAALFAPDPKKDYRKRSKKDEESMKGIPVTPRASQEIERVRRESGFHAQLPSSAMRRNTVTSRISSRASISLYSVSGIRNLFKRESEDVKLYASIQELDLTPEQFYKEISRRTFARGGEIEHEFSIEQLKEIGDVAKIGDTEVEEPEQPGDFETPDEYLISRLKDFQNMKELSQIRPSVDSARWTDCCQTFQINPHETGLSETVKLVGLKTPLYQYQAYGAYWQMKTSRELGGGFVADEMGLGKTLSFFAYMVAERQLSWLWNEVGTTRANHGRRHLNEIEHTQGDRCPSRDERPGWIACPCASSSPTSRWPAKAGVRLAVVPQAVILTWSIQWNTHIDDKEGNLGLRLVIAHDAANPIPAPTFGNADARHARNVKELSAKRNIFDSKASKYYEDTAKLHQDRYLVLTTTHSYKNWVKKFEYKGQFLSYAKSAENPTWVSDKSRGIVFGFAMIDECHEEYFKEKGRSGVLSHLPLTNNPFIWGYSGTPIINSPRNLEGVLWAIEQHFPRKDKNSKATGWEDDPVLSQYHYRAFDLICKDFEKHIKNNTGSYQVAKQLEEDFTPFLAWFMIRRTADSTWFGRPLIKLKKHIHQDVVLAHNPKYDPMLVDLVKVIQDEAQEKFLDLRDTWKVNDPLYQQAALPTSLTFNQRCRVEWRLRIIASFPFLVTLSSVHHKHYLTLTTEEVIKYKGTEVYKSPYSMYLRQITESSMKCIWLHQYITELIQTADIDMKEQKLIIVTQFNPAALILKLFIERIVLPKDKKNCVGLICAGMKARDRIAILDAFTDTMDKESSLRKQKNNIQILVGITRLIGTGLQLTRAANLVLVEPDYEFYRELQSVARIHRIGQKNQRSYSFRLINEGAEIENRIVKRQEARGEVHGKEVKTRLLSQVVAEHQQQEQQEEMNNGIGLMPVDELVREEWVQEHEDFLDQFPSPPTGTSDRVEGDRSRFSETFLVVHGLNEEDGSMGFHRHAGRTYMTPR